MWKVVRNVKVDRSTTFAFTRSISYIAFILFTRVKFKSYATEEMHFYVKSKSAGGRRSTIVVHPCPLM